MANALKKITTAAKKLYKKGGTWKGAMKKASAAYRGGKLKTKRRRSVGAVKKTRKRSVARRTSSRKRSTRKARTRTVVVIGSASGRSVGTVRRRRRSTRRKVTTRRRRVGSARKDNFIKTLAIGGLALGLIVAFTRNKPAQTVYVPTGNNYRDSTASTILSYANMALLSASQIAALIQRINNSSDEQLSTINASLQAGTPVSAYA